MTDSSSMSQDVESERTLEWWAGTAEESGAARLYGASGQRSVCLAVGTSDGTDRSSFMLYLPAWES